MSCPECGLAARERGDIISFTSAVEGPNEPDALEELAMLVEGGPIREATNEWITDRGFDDRIDKGDVRSELFDVGRDAWRIHVGDEVTGRCLDVHAGFGRRSMVLAELAETVYAVDTSLSKLRVAAAREDFESVDRVVPVHADSKGLPFAEGAFDTIVADTTKARGPIGRQLAALAQYLDEGGTMIATVDGWPRRSGLVGSTRDDDSTHTFDSVDTADETVGGTRPATPGGFRSLGEELGFDHVSTYALVPSASRPLYVFDVDNEDAVRTLADFVLAERPALEFVGKPLVSLADRCGLLKRSYPSYLVVYESDGRSRSFEGTDLSECEERRFCSSEAGSNASTGPSNEGIVGPPTDEVTRTSTDGGSSTNATAWSPADQGRPRRDTSDSLEFTRPISISGRARSVVLELDGDGPTDVWKLPNRRAHEPLTERENSVLDVLRSGSDSFVEALPEGEGTHSPFGTCRRERPVTGRPLEDELGADPESFERVLRLGFEWLIDFQLACRGERVVRTPAEVREALRFAPAGLEPPAIDESVETFYTPVHGDYSAQNVHVDGDRVTGVIDWEYGALEANPIVDAGFLVLDAAAQTTGDLYEGVRTVLCSDSAYADRARRRIGAYCDAVGIPRRTFVVFLPSVYVHRLRLDWRYDATSTYSGRMEDRARVTEFLFDQLDSITLE